MKRNKMKQVFLLISLIFAHQAFAVCSSPIARTNFSANQVLTSTRLNADLNAAYTRANELPGDCITSESVTTTQIDDGTIATADIANGAVTAAKLSAVNYVISSTSSGSFSTSSTSEVDVTNMTTTITTTGRPVIVSLQGGNIEINAASTEVSVIAYVGIYRGVTLISTDTLLFAKGVTGTSSGMTIPPGSIQFMDAPAAGSYTYKVVVRVFGTGMTIHMNSNYLVTREL